MGAIKVPNKTTWILLVLLSLLATKGLSEAKCSYVTSTVLDSSTEKKLPGVKVFVTDVESTEDYTRSDDGLYSLTVGDRGMPYSLEFRKEGYQPNWLSNLSCTGKLEELPVVYMTKTSEMANQSDANLDKMIENYKSAMEFASKYHQPALKKRVTEALKELRLLLEHSNRRQDKVMQNIERILR